MATYTTNLKSWGSNGSEYPDGYNYEKDVPPVDVYDNFLTSNLIDDVQHLVDLTNDRIETDSGSAGAEPTSPEASHLYHDQGNDRLRAWDGSVSSWRDLMFRDGDTMTGSLAMNGYGISGTGDISSSGGTTIFNSTAGHIPEGAVQQGSGSGLNADQVDGFEAADLGSDVSDSGTKVVSKATDINFGNSLNVSDDADGTVTVNAVTSSDTQTAVSEDGTEMYASVGDINFRGHLNLIDDGDGTVSVDPTHNHDSRYYTQTQVDSNFDNYGSFTLEEGDGESTAVGSGERAVITGGGGLNTELTSATPPTVRIGHNNTSDQGNVTTGGATVIDDISLDGYGHVSNLNTENRSLDDWNAPTSTVYFDRNGIQSNEPWLEIDGAGSGLLLNYKNQNEETRVYGTLDVRGGLSGVSLGDLNNVSASGEGSGNNFDADTVDGQHASDLGAPSSTNSANGISNGSWRNYYPNISGNNNWTLTGPWIVMEWEADFVNSGDYAGYISLSAAVNGKNIDTLSAISVNGDGNISRGEYASGGCFIEEFSYSGESDVDFNSFSFYASDLNHNHSL